MQRLLFLFFSRLPLPVLHFLAGLLGGLLYHLQTRHRYFADTNLKLCFPELSDEERCKLSRQSVIGTARTLLESPLLLMGKPARVTALVKEVSGEHLLEKAMSAGKGVIVICPHLGNWEMAGLHLSHLYPMTSMYRPQRNSQLDHLIRQGRERFGARLVPSTNKGLRELLKTLQQGGMIGTLPDQNPGAGTGEFVPFFGIITYTPVFAARLAARTGARVLNVTALRLPKSQGFRIEITEASPCIHDPDTAVATTCMNRDLEAMIRPNISQYWWSYNRFRTRPSGEAAIYSR